MIELPLAVAVFILTHLLPGVPGLRDALIARLGRPVYFSIYGFVSSVMLVWIGFAYARAPFIPLWDQETWMRWVPALVMPAACVLLAGGLTARNPLSLNLRAGAFDPGRPGLVGLVRHPVMWASALWAAAHIPPNGDVASVLLFGLLLLLSLLGPAVLDRRRKGQLGEAEWARLAAARGRLRGTNGWFGGVLGGAILYVALPHAHEYVIGASPWP